MATICITGATDGIGSVARAEAAVRCARPQTVLRNAWLAALATLEPRTEGSRHD